MSPLAAWANFYVITGTAAATLTGLMFVVITLIVGGTTHRSSTGLSIYSTPTVVHFVATIVVVVLLSAPWPTLWEASIPLGLVGTTGLVYSGIVMRRSRHQGDYHPVLEDWLCHAILPTVAYVALIIAAVTLPWRPVPALFDVAAVIILFLALGIHNAWDIVTFITFAQADTEGERQE